MKRLMQATRGEILAFLLIVLIVAPLAVALIHKAQAAQFTHEMKKMNDQMKTTKMKTVCVGRFLIDIPADAWVTFRPARIDSWNVLTDAVETDEEFTAALAKKEGKLSAAKNDREGDSLEKMIIVNQNDFHGKIFEYGRRWTTITLDEKKQTIEDVSVDGHVRSNNISFHFTGNGGLNPGEEKMLSQLINRQLKLLADNEIPQEPGFCFDRAIMHDPLTVEQYESVIMYIQFKDHPDVQFRLSTRAGTDPDPDTLFERDDKNSVKIEYRSRYHTFRRAVRSLAGIAGEEIVERVSELNGMIGHLFVWETQGIPTDLFSPYLYIEFVSGVGQSGTTVNSSISDAAAVALWDKITSSLRIRPTKAATSEAAVPVIPPLGSHASANTTCPVNGWWRCNDGDDRIKVEHGDLHYFYEGERMRQAVLLAPPTTWQRLTGERVRFKNKMETIWTLASYRKVPRPRSAALPLVANATPHTADTESLPDNSRGTDDRALQVPVGTLAATNNRCPASGWWSCPETVATDGARWFKQGEPMPKVSIEINRTWWERLRGFPSTHSTIVSWQLLRRDQAPLMSAIQEPTGTSDLQLDRNT